MSNFKRMLRLCILLGFMLPAAVGVGFGGAAPIPPARKEDRIVIVAEKQDEDEEDAEGQEIAKYQCLSRGGR